MSIANTSYAEASGYIQDDTLKYSQEQDGVQQPETSAGDLYQSFGTDNLIAGFKKM